MRELKRFDVGDYADECRSIYVILRGKPLCLAGGFIVAGFALTSLLALIGGTSILPYNPLMMNLTYRSFPPRGLICSELTT
jgi:hypothetical protein